MPVTRSAAVRNKIQTEELDSDSSFTDTNSTLDKHHEDINGHTRDKDMLPKTVDETSTVENEKHLKTRTAILLLFAIFACSATALAFVYYSFPHLEKNESEHVKFPKTIDDAKQLGLVLSRYKEKYYPQVLGGVFVTYLFLQTFAIPGSIFLSIVSGYLFSFPVALLLICFCSATGASFCYLLSYLVGRRLVKKYLPQRSANWAKKVQKHKDSLMSYIIFLRITPFLPNWFINIVSPVIDVHLKPFWIGTFIGVAPPSFIAIQAGTTLQQLTSTTDALSVQSIALLVVFAFLSILPAILKNRKEMKAYFSGNPHQEPEPDSVDNEPEQVNLDKVDETSSSLTQIQRENVIEANVEK